MSTNGIKHAIVTGGTSGIGLAVVGKLLSEGFSVSTCARTAAAIEELSEKHHRSETSLLARVCDVRAPEQIREFVSESVAAAGPVDVLVNNAGRSGGGVTADLPDELWKDVIDTNLNSIFIMTKAVLNDGLMRQRDTGRIINIASTAGKQGVVLGAAYSASKHGVVGFTKALGNELGPTGITVNAVCPGYVETPMAVALRQRHAAAFNKTEDQIKVQFTAKIPLGRYSTPSEVAGLVHYLTSDDAASITAQAINVCGGLGNF